MKKFDYFLQIASLCSLTVRLKTVNHPIALCDNLMIIRFRAGA